MTSGTTPPQFPAFPEKLPLDQENLTPRDQAFLEAIQGNVLKGHGRDFQRLVFFRFPYEKARARDFLRATTTTGRDKDERWATSAALQMMQRDNYYLAFAAQRRLDEKRLHGVACDDEPELEKRVATGKRQLFSSIMLTHSGLRKLGSDFADQSEAFRYGLQKRVAAATDELREKPYCLDHTNDSPDGIFLLACDDECELEASAVLVREWGQKEFDLAFLDEVEKCLSWRMPGNPYGNGYQPPREAFGFADGISQPQFFKKERENQVQRPNRPQAWEWTDLKLEGVFIERGPHAGGTFATVLKIEQKVATFREYEAALAKKIHDAYKARGITETQAAYLAAALLMGRTRQGYPLGEVLGQLTPEENGLMQVLTAKLKQPTPTNPSEPLPEPPPHSPAWLNQFDFENQADVDHSPDGRHARRGGCPFHVHLRKMNPRTANSDHDTKENFIKAQPVRRGAVFDPAGRLRRAEEGRAGWPDEGAGLLFLAYMRDIVVQFEQLHNSWTGDLHFPANDSGIDPVLVPADELPGDNLPEDDLFKAQGLRFGGMTFPKMPRVFKRLGGFYLYTPSITWLERGGC